MKKISIIILILSVFCLSLYSQLEVHTDGSITTGIDLSVGEDLAVARDVNVARYLTVSNRITTPNIVVNNQAAFYSTSTFTDDLNHTSGTLFSNNFIMSGQGFKTSKTDYYTVEMIWDRSNSSLYSEMVGQWYPTGSLGTSSHQWSSTYTNSLYLNGVYHTSDLRAKENIRPFSYSSIGIIKNLNPVKFDYKSYGPAIKESDNKDIKSFEERRKNKTGFIAQEVLDVYPEAIVYDSTNDQYYIDYISFIPLLTKALQEQESIINNLDSEVKYLRSVILEEEFKKSVSLSTNIVNKENITSPTLYQNSPNPFGETTSIRYSLPEGTTDADIIIYDMTGKQLQRIPLTQDGKSSIEVNGGELDPGMYMYTMIKDDTIIDTKQMIIIK